MDCHVRLLVFKKKSIYEDVIATTSCLCKYEEFTGNCDKMNQISDIAKQKLYLLPLGEKGFNAYLVSLYIKYMQQSDYYRIRAINLVTTFIKTKIFFDEAKPVILLKLRTPKHQFIDYNWSDRLTRMILERQEIDHAMSWLSTLGGAFSALGDQYDHCAKVAGKISVEQFKLAFRLGDPQLVARCNLYAALSLLQQGYIKVSARMVKEIYRFAKKEKDRRLQNMCLGVWAKLKYCSYQRKLKCK